MARWMANVAPVAAKLASFSPAGIADARPDMRVNTTLWATPGTVSSRPSSAAAAEKAGTPGGQRVGNSQALQAAGLLGDGAVDGQVSRMESRHIFVGGMGSDKLSLYLVECHGRGVDDSRPARAVLEELGWDDGAGVEAYGAAGEQIPAAYCDQVCRAGAGAYEVDGHGMMGVVVSAGCGCAASALTQAGDIVVLVVSARAQVTGPTAIRGPRRRGAALAPPSASPTTSVLAVSVVLAASTAAPATAAASATEWTFIAAMECSERVSVAGLAASRADWEINISGMPRAAAAAMMPGSRPFAAGVAIADSVLLAVGAEPIGRVGCTAGQVGSATPADLAASTEASAASMAAWICSALTPERQPIPATIRTRPRSIG